MPKPIDSLYIHGTPPAGAAPSASPLRLDHAAVAARAHLGHRDRGVHQHDVYHLVLYTAGRGSFIFQDQEVPVRAPFLVLIAPGQWHSFSGGPGDDSTYSEITFAGSDRSGRPLRLSWLELMRERYHCPCALPAFGPIERAAAMAITEAISDIVASGLAGGAYLAQIIDGLLTHALFVLFRSLVVERASDAANATGDSIERARALIETRVIEAPPLAEIAQAVGLSSKHLTRAFKRRFGMPPVQYRRRAAMEQAAILLRGTRTSVEIIAEGLGYDDPAYFCRVFSQIHGMPPRRFREKHLLAGGEI